MKDHFRAYLERHGMIWKMQNLAIENVDAPAAENREPSNNNGNTVCMS